MRHRTSSSLILSACVQKGSGSQKRRFTFRGTRSQRTVVDLVQKKWHSGRLASAGFFFVRARTPFLTNYLTTKKMPTLRASA